MKYGHQIEHVVVLMMENRSFDHLLGDFGRINAACEGIPQSTVRGNDVNGVTCPVQPWPLPISTPPGQSIDTWVIGQNGTPSGFDPKHELLNMARQLGLANGRPDMSGFAQDAWNAYQGQAPFDQHLDELVSRVMSYVPFADAAQNDPLPAIQGLARQFTVCDHWFSSLPGPTWPNRFFALMGSAHGRVSMPSNWKDFGNGVKTFLKQVCQTSIFTMLDTKGVSFQLYADGGTPLAYMVKDSGARRTIKQFEQDVLSGDLPAFSWIEPDYGLVGSDGNSQHPPEDLRLGDAFIARVFNGLTANAEVWSKSLFVLLYDEHGGFFDHVVPPAAVAPDGFAPDINWDAVPPFAFDRLGVRVPAILASPWIGKGIDKTSPYDHTSLLAFVCDRFGLDRAELGARVSAARHFGDAEIWETAPREDAMGLKLAQLDTASITRGFFWHETPLATDSRMLIQGLHAYLHGRDVRAAVGRVPGSKSRAIDDLPSPPQLETMANEVRQLLDAGGPAVGSGMRAGRRISRRVEQAKPPIKVLCLHGVGHGDAQGQWQADPDWQEAWTQIIVGNLQANGYAPDAISVDFWPYDALFGSGPSIGQIARGIAMLVEGLVEPQIGERGLLPPIGPALRWTAGMTVQWIEDAGLRDKLCAGLKSQIEHSRPQIILAHSLGSLIGYDTLRRSIAAGVEQAAALDGTAFVSFGSQIAHKVVMREVWAGRVMPLHTDSGAGVSRWFHLFNPRDKVFTEPITVPDAARTDLTTEFEAPNELAELISLDHSATQYIDHPVARQQMWPALATLASAPPAQVRAITQAPALATHLLARPRRALLVGINAYPDPNMRLDGCVNDVYLMSKTLQESGYEAGDIRLLVDERATQAAIVERLQWLVEGAQEGDERVFFYSGHGAQIPAYGVRGEPDHMVETLVPYDFSWDDAATHFTDKEFRQFYSQLPFGSGRKSARLTAIFDCCHAAGMTRSGGRVRGISPPPDIRHRMLEWDALSGEWVGRGFMAQSTTRRAYTAAAQASRPCEPHAQGTSVDLRPVSKARMDRQCRLYGHPGPYMPLLLYAARESELASEYVQGASTFGAFTFALVDRLRQPRQSSCSFEDLMAQVTQVLQGRKLLQHPELVGPKPIRESQCPWLHR